jgi:hypothetical protein
MNRPASTHRTSPRRRLVVAIGVAIALAGLATAPVAAESDQGFRFTFTECSGPSGIPPAFDAILVPGGLAPTFLLADSSTVWVSVDTMNLTTGESLQNAKGFAVNGLETITCRLRSPFSGHDFLVTGFFTPARR